MNSYAPSCVLHRLSLVMRIVLAVVLSISGSLSMAQRVSDPPASRPAGTPQRHEYLGMWVTRDGYIRHELLSNGRYDEERGGRKSAYQGRYWIKGDRIDYIDDTGFSADGEFRGGVFYHGGYVFYRSDKP